MSDKTERALLSENEIDDILGWAAEREYAAEVFASIVEVSPQDMIKATKAIFKLSAHIEAQRESFGQEEQTAQKAGQDFRQQVADELASLLEEPTEHKDTSYDEESYWVAIDLMQEKARALATRLGIEL